MDYSPLSGEATIGENYLQLNEYKFSWIFSKVILQFVKCLARFENASKDLKSFCFAFCNNFFFHVYVRKLYKTRKSTLSCIGNFEENIDLSHIHLAVQVNLFHKPLFLYQLTLLGSDSEWQKTRHSFWW